MSKLNFGVPLRGPRRRPAEQSVTDDEEEGSVMSGVTPYEGEATNDVDFMAPRIVSFDGDTVVLENPDGTYYAKWIHPRDRIVHE